jgi:hypothetical protein
MAALDPPLRQELDAMYAPAHLPPANTAFWKNMASQVQPENNASPDDIGFRFFTRQNQPNIGDIIFLRSRTGYSGSLFLLKVGRVVHIEERPDGLFGRMVSLHSDPQYGRYPGLEFRGPVGSNIADSDVSVLGDYEYTYLGNSTLWRPVSEVALAGGSKRRKSRRRSKKRRSTRFIR